MGDDDLVALMTAWDECDNAAQRVLTSLPSQMTFAAAALDSARQNMRSKLQNVVRANHPTADSKGAM